MANSSDLSSDAEKLVGSTPTSPTIYGPYLRKDGRKHIIIIYPDGRRRTKSYPKHLLEQKIGRELVDNETCDHDDGDFRNDDPTNLIVMSRSDNAIKASVCVVEFDNCKYCGRLFKLSAGQRNSKKDGPFCTKHCVGKVHH